jgi:hypothetical protein
MAELEELLKKKEKVERKLAEIKPRLGHAHLDFMSVHDLAETEFKVYSAYLADIQKQIIKLENEKIKNKK